MALYLPRAGIAIELVDDPRDAPYDPEAFPNLALLRVREARPGICYHAAGKDPRPGRRKPGRRAKGT